MEQTSRNSESSEANENNAFGTLGINLAATLTLALNGEYFKYQDEEFLRLAAVAAFLQDISTQREAYIQSLIDQIQSLNASLSRMNQKCVDLKSENAETPGLLEIPEAENKSATRH